MERTGPCAAANAERIQGGAAGLDGGTRQQDLASECGAARQIGSFAWDVRQLDEIVNLADRRGKRAS